LELKIFFMAMMSSLRRLLVPILILFAVGYQVRSVATSKNIPPQVSTLRELSLEDRLLLMQGRTLIGAKLYLPELLKDPALGAEAKTLERSLSEAIAQITEQVLQNTSADSESARYTLREKTILALRIGEPLRVEEFLNSLESSSRTEAEVLLDQTLFRIIREQLNGKVATISESEEVLLSSELFDFAKFLHVEESAGNLVLPSQMQQQARDSAARFLTGIGVLGSVILAATLSFAVFFTLWIRGNLRSHFRAAHFPAHYLGEVFFLYLALMFGSPALLSFLIDKGVISDPLVGNIFLILGTILTLTWPLFFRVRIGALLHSAGIFFGGFRKVIADVVIAPFFYLASWVVLSSVLVIYSLALTHLKIDIAQGAHPIVPILLAAEDQQTPILILVLATLIAPIVEEIMFRGVFYGYLRSFLHAPAAILVSALGFAAIHPQGIIGIVPLTAIGCILAIIREWRGSLIAPIIVHACVNGGTLLMLRLMFG